MRYRKLVHATFLAAALAMAMAPDVARAVGEDDPPMEVDTRAGVLAAVGCGLGLRAMVLTGGMNAGVNAAAVSMCLFMVIDAWGT